MSELRINLSIGTAQIILLSLISIGKLNSLVREKKYLKIAQGFERLKKGAGALDN